MNSCRTHWSLSSQYKIHQYDALGIRDPLSYARRTRLEPLSDLTTYVSPQQIRIKRNPQSCTESSTLDHAAIPQILDYSSNWQQHNCTPLPSSHKIYISGQHTDSIVAWAIVIYDPLSQEYHWASGALTLPPHSFLPSHTAAHYIAAIAAVHHLNLDTHCIFSSNLSVIKTINNTPTQRNKLRHKCRPLANFLHMLCHDLQLCWTHVPLKNSIPSLRVRGTLFATDLATTATHLHPHPLELTSMEPSLMLLINNNVVHSDYNTSLRKHQWDMQVEQWAKCPRQGLLPRFLKTKTLAFLHTMRKLLPKHKHHEPWLLDTLCSNLPCARTYHINKGTCPLRHYPPNRWVYTLL